MRVSVFAGDLCDAPADALCTSTNPRLSLAMGTGGSVRDRGGHAILRECEEIVEAEYRRSGRRSLPAGSAHLTAAGDLPAKVIVHCVASDEAHRSSTDVIRSCVRNALARAEEAGCGSIAMPLFGTGHVRFSFDRALTAMAEALRDTVTTIEHAIIVVYDRERADDAVRRIRSVLPVTQLDFGKVADEEVEPVSMWSEGWGDS
jgi:O-acetyl-ADP-ribose deacetylase (regulator of RNase III)